MKYEIKEKNGSEVQIRLVVSAEEFKGAVEAAYKKDRKKFNLPGFRKGMAPKGLIEKYYGEGVFFETAINSLIPKHYEAALSELSIDPVAKPDFDIESLGKDQELVMICTVTVEPEYTLEGYLGVEAKKIDSSVTDEEVDSEIKKAQKQYARLVTVDRESKNGDIVVIDYEGSVDGELFDGGSAKGHSLTLGSGQFIPGFEEQLVGKKAGEEVLVNVTFPAEYHSEELAGKDAQFKVNVHEVKFSELPELNDEFAQDVSEFDTLEEYKASVRTKLSEDKQKYAESKQQDEVILALYDKLEVELPEKMVEAELDAMIDDFSHQLSHQGLSFDLYAQYMGGAENVKNQMRNDAINRIKTSLILKRVVKEQNLVISDEEIEQELSKIAEDQKREVKDIRKIFERDNFEYLRHTLLDRKAINLLVEKATLV